MQLLSETNLLTTLTFLPMVGALLLLFVKGERVNEIKGIALFTSLLTFFLSLLIFQHFDGTSPDQQMVLRTSWIEAFNINYAMGIDGISLYLVLLTTFLVPVVIAASFGVKKRIKEYMISMLVLQVGMIGAFCALDLFLFYVFFEVMLIPMYFLIGIWGGDQRKYAAGKFFIYTLGGSLLMFAAILYASYAAGGTFDIAELTERLPAIWAQEGMETASLLCFLAFMLSFAIKTPLFPFHTWLPDAHTEAPTGGSVILAGVMLKLGTYGMLRFGLGFFPEQMVSWADVFVVLSVIGIIYGALMALQQEDFKKLVAYSSVSHLGFVVLGIFAFNAIATQGALLQMINHGLSTGLLFLLVGAIYERRHTRMLEDFGGLAKVMPRYAVFLMIATLASIGLPGLNGFIGEFMILAGSFGSADAASASGFEWTWMRTATLFAGTGVILGAVYMLTAYQKVVFGKLNRPENMALKDLSSWEGAYLIPMTAMCFVIGLMPNIFLAPMEASIEKLVAPAAEVRQLELSADLEASANADAE